MRPSLYGMIISIVYAVFKYYLRSNCAFSFIIKDSQINIQINESSPLKKKPRSVCFYENEYGKQFCTFLHMMSVLVFLLRPNGLFIYHTRWE